MRRSVRLLPLLLVAFVVGCGEAKNTPEQALAQVKDALKTQHWELLYDVVPSDLQKVFDAQMEDINSQVKEVTAKYGASKADSIVRDKLGLSLSEWEHADTRKRFALTFAPTAKLQLADLGVNADEVLSSEVKNEEVKGDQAFFVIDDGKGHRSKLRFKLEQGMWRFDLEKIKKDGGG